MIPDHTVLDVIGKIMLLITSLRIGLTNTWIEVEMLKFILCKLLNKHKFITTEEYGEKYPFCSRCGVVEFMSHRKTHRQVVQFVKKLNKKR